MEQVTLVDFERQPIRRLISDVNPLSLRFSLGDRGENYVFLALDVAAITGNVVCTIEQSFDGGTTWEVVAGITGGTFNSTGMKKIYMTSASGVISPVCRLVITPAAGQTCQLNNIKRLTGIRTVALSSPVSVDLGPLVVEATLTNVKLDTLIAATDTLEANTDQLETLITSTNTKLDTVNTNLGDIDLNTDGLEALITSTNAKLDTLITQTDGLEVSVGNVDVNTDQLETLVGATNTKLDTVITQTDGIEGSLTSIDSKLPVSLGQKLSAGSLSVVMSSDSATPLPTGAATEVTLGKIEDEMVAALIELSGINGGLPDSLGRKAATGSTGVVLSTEDKTSLDAIGTKLDTLIAKTSGSLITVAHDAIVPNESGLTTNVYVYKTGGVGGTTVATLTITYTGADKLVATSYVVT